MTEENKMVLDGRIIASGKAFSSEEIERIIDQIIEAIPNQRR